MTSLRGPCRDRAITLDRSDGGAGEVRIWDLPAARLAAHLSSPGFGGRIDLDPTGGSSSRARPVSGRASLALFDLTPRPAPSRPYSTAAT